MVLYDERASVDHFSRTLQADVETIHYYFSFFSEVSFIVQCSIMLEQILFISRYEQKVRMSMHSAHCIF